MRIRNHIRGMTFIEMTIVAAIFALVVGVLVAILSKNVTFFQNMRVRQKVMAESRTCMDTILLRLRNGKAGTLVIKTPLVTSPTLPVPNSQIEFDLQDPLPSGATKFLVRLDPAEGIVYTQEINPNGAPRPLASNVTGLLFTSDANDPAIVNVTLRIEAAYDALRDPTRTVKLVLPNQTVRMSESP